MKTIKNKGIQVTKRMFITPAMASEVIKETNSILNSIK